MFSTKSFSNWHNFPLISLYMTCTRWVYIRLVRKKKFTCILNPSRNSRSQWNKIRIKSQGSWSVSIIQSEPNVIGRWIAIVDWLMIFFIPNSIPIVILVGDPEFCLKNSLYLKTWKLEFRLGVEIHSYDFSFLIQRCIHVHHIIIGMFVRAQTHTNKKHREWEILSKLVCCQLATMLLHGFRHIFSTITKIALQLLPILQFHVKLFIWSSIKSHIKFNILYNVFEFLQLFAEVLVWDCDFILFNSCMLRFGMSNSSWFWHFVLLEKKSCAFLSLEICSH